MKAKKWIVAGVAAIMAISSISLIYAQDESGMDGSSGDGSEYSEEPAAEEPASESAQDPGLFQEQSPDMTSSEPQGMPQMSNVQNAVLEGIQLSSEKGQQPDEITVTCYFIFRDKPSSYFYEAKPKESKLVFEFNDTETGISPIPSMQEKPVQGFRVESKKIDINAEVKGLNPEWHDVTQVSLFMDAIPEIAVKDEYSVISFSFNWSTDPAKLKEYVVKDESKRNRALLFGIGGGVGLAAGGAVLWYFLQPKPEEDEETGPLSTADLPVHPNPFP